MSLNRFLKTSAVVVAVAVVWVVPAAAAKKLALVFGNGAYANATALPNPPNDASDMANTLAGMGFEVVSAIDATKADMDVKIREFAEKSEDAELTLFFYAGHGMQVNGVNYLIPVDAKLEKQTSLDFETVNAENIIRYMSSDTRAGLVFLDACRDNPLSRSFQKKSRSTSVGSGLASRTASDQNLLIAYATSPGQVALDGTGRNSPFTTALLNRLPQAQDDVASVLTDVAGDVQKATKSEQIPWMHSSFTRKIYLQEREPVAQPDTPTEDPASQKTDVVVAVDDSQAEAKAAWEAVKDVESPAALETVAKRYAGTIYGDLAAARAQELRDADKKAADLARKQAAIEAQKKAAAEAKKKQQLAALEENQPQVDEPPSKPKPVKRSAKFRWAVVIASYTKEEASQARNVLKEARSSGLQAELIDTDNYAQLTPGLFAVVIGANSRGDALNLEDFARGFYPDAYAKQLQ
jgi:uncharacterized caspase-like protein